MQRKKVALVYLAGLLQGLALVAFPAASSIFTSAKYFDFSSASYGALFIPQAIFSILTSLFSANIPNALLIGLFANCLSMMLLATSAAFTQFAYGILLLATGILGIGFGLTVPALNTYAAQFFPKKIDTAILILNALLGLGTALAPVLVALFLGFSIWWALPALLSVLLLLLFFFALSLKWDNQKASLNKEPIPRQFWMFATFALVYGMVETMNANWATIFMENQHASTTIASLALTSFWAMVTLGRIFFSLFSGILIFRIIPFIAAISFILIAMTQDPMLGIVAFGLAGLGCSALLPLTLSLGTKAMASTKFAGGMIAFYLLGYGISAFGVGALQDLFQLNLTTIFNACSLLALLLGMIAFRLTKRA